ncbi:hypothetical protein, conserved [Eimeria necatrix]|uniref:Uncharacterized protein n=1 Tax=Eimeria necatrix TaxID=51315 RepID=U6MTW2_9EIME|nr:hypothetical protein, conserved [Eimeria necatrix]CDJ65090.1 hypothetical protein, conserved [Eimeria necatrix]
MQQQPTETEAASGSGGAVRSNDTNTRATLLNMQRGGVKEILRNFERKTQNGPVQSVGGGTVLRHKQQEVNSTFSSSASERKLQELQSVLKHREELIRSLEGAVAQRESDLSFVLKEKFHLSKEIVASRSASQPSGGPCPFGVHQNASVPVQSTTVGNGISLQPANSCTAGEPQAEAFAAQRLQPESSSCSDPEDRSGVGVPCSFSGTSRGPKSDSRKAPKRNDCGEAEELSPKRVTWRETQSPNRLSTEEIDGAEEMEGTAPADAPREVGALAATSQSASSAHSCPRQSGAAEGDSTVKQELPVEPGLSFSGDEDTVSIGLPPEAPEKSCSATSAADPRRNELRPSKCSETSRSKDLLANAAEYLDLNSWRLDKNLAQAEQYNGCMAVSVASEGKHKAEEAKLDERGRVETRNNTRNIHFSTAIDQDRKVVDGAGEGGDPTDSPDLHSGTRFQAELFFKALLVQTQAMIEAEAETSDVLEMQDELSSKIDFLQNAFEEICQELDAARKENRALVQRISLNDTQKNPITEPSEMPTASNKRTTNSGECASSLSQASLNLTRTVAGIQKEHHEESMEEKLEKALLQIRSLEEKYARSESALSTAQAALNEARNQITFLQQRCELLQEFDKRTWQLLEKLMLNVVQEGGPPAGTFSARAGGDD